MGRYLLRLRRKSVLRLSNLWRRQWSERSRIVIVAMLIGTVAAVAAAALHYAVHKLEIFAEFLGRSSSPWLWSLLVILPVAGVVLSFFSQRLLGGPRYAKSLSPLILALHRRKTRIPFRETFSHVISSALSVGCGGSAGLEAPSVLTGAAIGANTSGFFGFDRRARMLLIGCGAAAAISAIFGSPIGGVLFAVEVLLPQFSVGALVPILIASALAMVISRTFFPHEQILFVLNEDWRSDAIPFYFVCGIVCSLIGVLLISSVYKISSVLKQKLPTPWRRLCVGGAILGVILAVFPIMRGQGYYFIKALFDGEMQILSDSAMFLKNLPPAVLLPLLIVVVIFLKGAVSALTVDSGGDGGIFAPAMMVGAFTGFAFARLVNMSGIIELQEPNFVVVGMCGVFSAVLRAPLTGVFLIAEVTYSYNLLVPLMIVSSVSWAVARHFEPHSVYRKALVESGLLSDDLDQSMLQTLSVRVCINTRFHALNPAWNTAAMRDTVANADSEIFPVLDDNGKLLGVVRMEQLKPVLFDPIMSSLLVYDLMEKPHGILSEDDDLARAMNYLERYRADVLPVNGKDGRFLGFVYAHDIFKLYRDLVRESDSF